MYFVVLGVGRWLWGWCCGVFTLKKKFLGFEPNSNFGAGGEAQ
jgi:hypothetical protein